MREFFRKVIGIDPEQCAPEYRAGYAGKQKTLDLSHNVIPVSYTHLMIVRWFVSGTVDHVPSTVFDHCPKLKRLFQQVGGHAGVKAWLERAAG